MFFCGCDDCLGEVGVGEWGSGEFIKRSVKFLCFLIVYCVPADVNVCFLFPREGVVDC